MILRIAQGDYLDIRIDIVDESGDPLYLEPGEKVIMHMNVRTAKGRKQVKIEGAYDANNELHFLSSLPDICPGIYRFGVDLVYAAGRKWCLCRSRDSSLIVGECEG